MISEPELDGGWEDPRPPDQPSDGPGPGPGAARPPARPWRWALGGVLASSVLWAGGLYAVVTDRQAAPEMAYRLPENLCQTFQAQALTRIAGPLHRSTPEHREATHPVLDQAVCMLSDRARERAGLSYFVTAQVALHKKTDPAAEFEVEPLLYEDSPEPSRVPDLGEQALMLVSDAGDVVQLKVRDGGAVVRLAVSATDFGDRPPDGEPERMDATAVQAALIEDMRALLAALRKH
ncbi:hypothetical protein DEJ50_20925 [Streptomyces venezuelae]|uniref:Uncharacterized protein n=1 Tax=Streptomyces venezuelae TaxID=54571 RepID=A0A5P2D5U7_STRVZ|nr:hypothetical protein [Streptomyces venezuelae]QES49920.1 hypothetical protein DEJ50_20925 [Streptomyces venezuelae]